MFPLKFRFQPPLSHADHLERILTRIFREKTGLDPDFGPRRPQEPLENSVLFTIQPDLGTEAFSIEDSGSNILITGADALGLLYGLGKFLHDAHLTESHFSPGLWRGTSVPQTATRGMYFAFHDNWYDHAPLEVLHEYVEDLTLWGMNSLVLHVHQHEDSRSPTAIADFQRNHAIIRHARQLGLRVGLLEQPNVGYSHPGHELPSHIQAAPFPDTDPERRGQLGNRVCPSQPDGFRYLSDKLDAYLTGFEDVGLDFVLAFPYDAGGCGCAQCWPWGAKGYVKISKEFSRLAKAKYPKSQFVLGTWCFDVREESDGEYEGLETTLAEDSSWVDIIMSDSHEEFPPYPLQPGSLAGLPIVNFAEISMWGRFPWGGSGANPLPARFQEIWDHTAHRLSGGFPYSEGNFEDINKVIFLRFFWDPEARAEESVREYLHYEFGSSLEPDLLEAVYLLEKTLPRWTRHSYDVGRAYDLILAAHEQLPARIRNAWRWQLLYQRAIIDFELETHGEVTDRCDAAYESLIRTQRLENGWQCVAPPSRAYKARLETGKVLQHLPPGSEPERDAEKAGLLVSS